ncbi:MAG TPA: hypothetical protein VHW46_02305 [Terracidiphilus sp.]|jgi:hypothetical protein|nr:hypothetical protein [Terracidiphilus sp.]
MDSMFHPPETGSIRTVPGFQLQFVPSRESSVLPFPEAHLHEKDWRVDGPGCVRGVRFALAIEAAAALMIYAVWQISHMVR